jgi:hypothetical protein
MMIFAKVTRYYCYYQLSKDIHQWTLTTNEGKALIQYSWGFAFKKLKKLINGPINMFEMCPGTKKRTTQQRLHIDKQSLLLEFSHY